MNAVIKNIKCPYCSNFMNIPISTFEPFLVRCSNVQAMAFEEKGCGEKFIIKVNNVEIDYFKEETK